MIGLPKLRADQQSLSHSAGGPGTMHSLRAYPQFRLLMGGTLANSTALWMYQVAVGWLALEMTDSPFFVGLSGAAGGISVLFFSIPAGVLIDRFDGRGVLLAAQGAAMLVASAFAVAIGLDLMRPWLILVLAFFYGSTMSFTFPARTTIVPSLVDRSDLSNAVALNSATQNVTRVTGPAIAGVLIAVVGIGGTFAVAAVIQIFALYSSFLLSPCPKNPDHRGPVSLASLTVGFKVVSQSPFLSGLVLLALAPTVLVMPYLTLMPVFARDEMNVGSGGLGLLLAATGIGAVCGALIVARSARLQRSLNAQFVTVMLFSLFVIVFAITLQFALGVMLLFLAGLMSAAWLALNQTTLHMNISDEFRGRVFSVYMMTWGMLPLGQLLIGSLADVIGPSAAVTISCVLSILCVLAIRRTFSSDPQPPTQTT